MVRLWLDGLVALFQGETPGDDIVCMDNDPLAPPTSLDVVYRLERNEKLLPVFPLARLSI
jgi:hypothetical protein